MTDHDTELAREITEKGLEEYSSSWKKANKKGDAGRPFRECMSEAITQALRSVRQEAEKKVIKEIEEGTRKVFGDGTKGPWKTLLGKVRQDENEKHEALIGVLVRAINEAEAWSPGACFCLSEEEANKAGGKTCPPCVLREALSHPLVQEYLKKEKI